MVPIKARILSATLALGLALPGAAADAVPEKGSMAFEALPGSSFEFHGLVGDRVAVRERGDGND